MTHSPKNVVRASHVFAANSLDDALLTWLHVTKEMAATEGMTFTGEPETTSEETARSWTASLTDGSRIIVVLTLKEAGKINVELQHDHLKDEQAAERWDAYWEKFLSTL